MWPFGSSCRSKARFVGKTALVTGANTGIGKETARDFYRRGARVILACRDLDKAKRAVEDLENSSQKENAVEKPGELVICRLNLGSLTSVKECARHLIATEPALHILVNNAGVMMCPYEKTEDGFENHFQSNYLGHFLLTLLLLPKMQQSAPGCRIVNVSSKAHMLGDIHFDDLNLEKSYTPLKGYAQSKLANILFSRELARRLNETGINGINVYSLHPGVVNTELGRHLDSTVFAGARTLARCIFGIFNKNPVQGAQTTIHCSVDESAGQETGLYYSECKVTSPSRKATDDELANALWTRTCELLHLNPKADLLELSKEATRASVNV